MTKPNLNNPEPNSEGITIDERTITVQGYYKDRSVQAFFHYGEDTKNRDKLKPTNRVKGIDVHGIHYLVDDRDIEYDAPDQDNKRASQIRKAYALTNYDPKNHIATGISITRYQNEGLLDQIHTALAERDS